MKNVLLLVLSLAVFSGVSLAQDAEKVKTAFEEFKSSVYSTPYYDYNAIFQKMDFTRASYMALRAKNPAAAVEVAPLLDQSVTIADGARTIVLRKYINMEACSLAGNEPQTFEQFQQALEEDLANANQVPEDFMVGVDIFRHALQNLDQNSRMDWVLQNAMTVMDAYNRLKETHSKGAMSREFCKPVKTGLGTEVNPAEFIQHNSHKINVREVEDDLDNFAEDMLKYSK